MYQYNKKQGIRNNNNKEQWTVAENEELSGLPGLPFRIKDV